MSEARRCNLTNELQRRVERSTCPGPRPERGREDRDQKYYQKKQMVRTEGSCNTRRMMLMRIEGSTNYPKDDDKEAMLCGCVMLMCTLVRLVVSACEWRGMLADTLVYQPGLCGSRTGARIAWVQGWGTHIGSALPMTDEPLANVLGQACAISVRSAIVSGHVGLF